MPTLWMDGWQPPKLADVFFGGVEGVYGLQSAPLFRQWCITTTLECFESHTHLNSCKNYICLLGGYQTIHLTRLRGVQGLIWGTRGAFLPAVAMVGYGCVGQCWLLEADIRSTYCRNSRNCLRKYFLYSFVDPIYSWHLTRQLKKEDLDLHTLLFSWFLCPVFSGKFYTNFNNHQMSNILEHSRKHKNTKTYEFLT